METLRVRVSDGSVAPDPLTVKRVAWSRAEILDGLTAKERMLVSALVQSLEILGELELWDGDVQVPGIDPAAKPLLRAFQDATGVDYVDCNWDVA